MLRRFTNTLFNQGNNLIRQAGIKVGRLTSSTPLITAKPPSNSQSFPTAQAAEDSIRLTSAELDALYHTTLGLINRLDVDRLLEDIVARTCTLVGTPHGYLYVLIDGQEEMEIREPVSVSAFTRSRHREIVEAAVEFTKAHHCLFLEPARPQ